MNQVIDTELVKLLIFLAFGFLIFVGGAVVLIKLIMMIF